MRISESSDEESTLDSSRDTIRSHQDIGRLRKSILLTQMRLRLTILRLAAKRDFLRRQGRTVQLQAGLYPDLVPSSKKLFVL